MILISAPSYSSRDFSPETSPPENINAFRVDLNSPLSLVVAATKVVTGTRPDRWCAQSFARWPCRSHLSDHQNDYARQQSQLGSPDHRRAPFHKPHFPVKPHISPLSCDEAEKRLKIRLKPLDAGYG
jgi:hypothetical protein